MDVTVVIGSSSCGLTLGSRFGENCLACSKLCFQIPHICGMWRRFGREIPLVALVYCFIMPLQIPFLYQRYRCIADQTNRFSMRKNKNVIFHFGWSLGSFNLSHVNVQEYVLRNRSDR